MHGNVWKAGISGGKGDSQWSFGVENGKAEAKKEE
jgi:hypothetical protein